MRSRNRLTDTAVGAFATALGASPRAFERLKELYLGGNPIADGVAVQLRAAAAQRSIDCRC